MDRRGARACVAAAVVIGVVAIAAAIAHGDVVRRPSSSPASDAGSFAAHVRDAATRYRVPEPLIVALIRVESDFNPRAVSPRGALGLMQLMPTTAMLYGARNALDPAQNIAAGARYLRELLDRFRDDVPMVIAAYNAGEVAVIRYGGIPPFPETRAFVAQVLSLIAGGSGRAPARDATDAAPSRATASPVAYHPRTQLDALTAGASKEQVLDVLATEWADSRGDVVKTEGLRMRVSRRSARRTLVEAGEVMLVDAAGAPALHWVLFEDRRLLAAGRVDEWPDAVARYGLDLDYVPGAPIVR